MQVLPDHLSEQSAPIASRLLLRVRAYAMLTKLRLSLIVVFSAGMGYLIAAKPNLQWHTLGWLLLGGMAITAAANTLNQIFEVRQDAQMQRTQLRPLPTRTLHSYEAWAFALVLATVGLVVLYTLHPICALLGAVAMCSYAFIYTPMKRWGVWAVYVGAIPGALPPMIGVVAASGQVTSTAWLLFLLQFIWQFPHFWAIAWVAHEDYARAGYHLLPSKGRDAQSALQIALYAFLLVPIGIMPWLMDYTSALAASVLAILGIAFFSLGLKLLRTKHNDDAMRIMFASFLYLPLALLTVYLDKITVQ